VQCKNAHLSAGVLLMSALNTCQCGMHLILKLCNGPSTVNPLTAIELHFGYSCPWADESRANHSERPSRTKKPTYINVISSLHSCIKPTPSRPDASFWCAKNTDRIISRRKSHHC